MAWTLPRTWNPGETVTASLMNAHVRDQLNVLAVFEKTGTLYDPNGITAGVNTIVWRVQEPCKVTAVRGYRVGGSGASINARKNGSTNFLSSSLSLTSTNTWMNGTLSGTPSNLQLAAGDKVELQFISPSGNPTQLSVQVELQLE